MLVLSRKEGERLMIGDNITLVVSKIAGNRVTVGIEAPADVKIYRGELKDEAKHQPKVVPLRRAATVTIDMDGAADADVIAALREACSHSQDSSPTRGFEVSELSGQYAGEAKAAM